MPSKQQIANLRIRIDLKDFVSSHSNTFPLLGSSLSGGSGKHQIAGPCPKCGGDDRFHVHKDTWGCRQCAPIEKGKRRDVFDLIIFTGLASDFKEAYAYAASWTNMPKPNGHSDTKQVRQSPERKERKPISQEWLKGYILKAQNQLAGPGLAYLTLRRGLTLETIKAFGLGFHPDCKLPNPAAKSAPAIIIPWRDGDGFSRVGFRYLEAQEYTDFKGKLEHLKYRVMGGMEWYHDALFSLERDSDTLAIVEGEFNAMSIAQVTPWDVVSFGSQEISQEQTERLHKLAAGYCVVLVWCDNPAKATQLKEALKDAGSLSLVAIKSPSNLDANDLLQRDVLCEFLAKVTGDLSLIDLTDWIGQTIDENSLCLIRNECARRYGNNWQLEATPSNEGWYIRKLIASCVQS